MTILLITLFYCLVMLVVSSLYQSTIMDPTQFLWVLCYLLIGPALLITSAIVLVRGVVRHSIRPDQIAVTGLSIITVAFWTFGFWRIGEVLRPVFFRLVASKNEQLAISFMHQHPPDAEAWVSGFCFPYYSLGSTRVSHYGGSVFIMVPSAPGPKDSLVYVSPDSAVPEGLQHITGSWYFDHAFPSTR